MGNEGCRGALKEREREVEREVREVQMGVLLGRKVWIWGSESVVSKV